MKNIIKSQFRASLTMLQGALNACDEALWLDPRYKHPFWRVAYHTLFFSDLYLAESVKSFVPWEKHADESQFLGPMIQQGGKMPKDCSPYGQEDIKAYCALTLEKIDPAVDSLNFDAPSGFPWLPFGKLELQFYNIRHIQHHTGQLIERIRQDLDKPVGWIISK